MTVQLKGNDTAKTVTFTVAGGGTIKDTVQDFPASLTLDSSRKSYDLLTFGHTIKVLQYMQNTEVSILNA